ncbi:hypothetical protein M422DRAFT_775407 [Sphaerobolus stellatus SS14]|nr:hypothetical protein M422DRAFT_775407 [Sphaerobolus stellatus SS14]
MKDSQLVLPVELLIHIFLYVTTDPADAARLCRVSKWVHDVVEPVLYRVTALKRPSLIDIQRRVANSTSRKHIRALGIVYGPLEIDRGAIDGPPLNNIRSCATDGTNYKELLNTSELEELHVFMTNFHSARGHIHRLKKLQLCYLLHALNRAQGPSPQAISSVLELKSLTHVAFSIREDAKLSGIVRAVKMILEHKGLLIMLVRLFRSTSLVLLGGAAEYESVEGRLASIKDPRLFIQRVDVDADPEALLDEWERNARAGKSIWDLAEEKLAGRRVSVRHIF